MKVFSYSQIWKIAYPILISTLMEQLIGMTDAAFLGRVGEVELGASALGGIFYIAVFMLGLGFSIGAQILMGRRNGEGNYERIGSIFYHSVAFLLLMAFLLFGLSQWLAPVLLEHIISSHEVFWLPTIICIGVFTVSSSHLCALCSALFTWPPRKLASSPSIRWSWWRAISFLTTC